MAADFFLKIAEVPGESQDESHAGEISVLSWSWGESNPSAGAFGGGLGSGKVNMQDFCFTMRFCCASPTLAITSCAGGTHYGEAVLTCRKAGGTQGEYLIITFSNVMVSSYQTGGSSGGDDFPTDSISLAYEKIKFEYLRQDESGAVGKPVKCGYDLKKTAKI